MNDRWGYFNDTGNPTHRGWRSPRQPLSSPRSDSEGKEMKKNNKKRMIILRKVAGVASGVVLSDAEAKDLRERDPRSVR